MSTKKAIWRGSLQTVVLFSFTITRKSRSFFSEALKSVRIWWKERLHRARRPVPLRSSVKPGNKTTVATQLSRLGAEGKLVSCTVTAPGRRPQEEYRIAAIQLKFNPHHFVISKKTNVRLRG